ncbi:MAG: hypothetical protein A3F16_02395 [Deltaproteobacteria bacterium RIFCSPHIGHO2_12_FULL_43_9]|nr:MAG: hypothetical protein A3F16_02395 [Deltaproteobacteria bacterium RIFCSPHIGHO2_12_FULL_43_9]
MWRRIGCISLISAFSFLISAGFITAQTQSYNNGKVTFDELMQETMTHVNQRSSFIADGRGPASFADPQPKILPDFLDKPPVVVDDFVVPALDVPFSEFDSAPVGAGFTYNWQAPWSGF